MVGVVAGRRARSGRVSPRALLVLCAVVIGCDIVISSIGIARFSAERSSHHAPRPGTRHASVSPAGPVAASRIDAHAVDWAVHELPRSASVLADLALSHALAAHGMRVVAADTAPAFVVSTPALRATARHSVDIARVLTASVPVAVLGSGSGAVVLRQVTAASPAQLATDARTRRAAENELLANPALTASPAAARLLRAGAVDLRCATFLAIAAATDRIQLVRVLVDPTEQAAGRPARSIEVRTSSATRLEQLIHNASAAYALAASTHLADGSWRLTWPIDVEPISGP